MILETECTGEILLISIFLLIKRSITYCPKEYMKTSIKNTAIFHTGAIPPVKTDSLIMAVSIKEAAIIIESIPSVQAFDSWKRILNTFNSL